MPNKKRMVVISATSSIAKHCARLWVEREPVDLVLVGRDKARLDAVAEDLKTRNSECSVQILVSDFFDPRAIQQTVDGIVAQAPVDLVLIAQGFLPNQKECETDLALCQQTMEINAMSPVLFSEAFAKHLMQANKGTLAVIGSVAGDRGRESTCIYGASKALLSNYMQGLRQRFDATGVRAVLIKPGPTSTPMTEHLQMKGIPFASVESVAKQIVRGIDKQQAVIYTPKKWRLIMFLVRLIPAVIFNKIKV